MPDRHQGRSQTQKPARNKLIRRADRTTRKRCAPHTDSLRDSKRMDRPAVLSLGWLGRKRLVIGKENLERSPAETPPRQTYCTKLKYACKLLIISEILVEAAGVEPASENVTGQENYMLSRVHAPGITLGRSRPALRTDKKRVPLACDLSLPPQT